MNPRTDIAIADEVRELRAVKSKIREYFRARTEFFLAATGSSTPEAFKAALSKASEKEKELREMAGI